MGPGREAIRRTVVARCKFIRGMLPRDAAGGMLPRDAAGGMLPGGCCRLDGCLRKVAGGVGFWGFFFIFGIT
jgi:hypothetical protein